MPNPSDTGLSSVSGSGGRLWFLATVPPPVNGQANCNAAMQRLLSGSVRLVPMTLGRSSIGKICRSLANSVTLLFGAASRDAAYISIPGQLGAWLLLPTIVVARLRGLTLWFHHHSFRSINLGPMPVMRAIVACAGSRQNHILLSDGMRDRFAGLYLRPGAGRAHAMSNTVLLAPDTEIALKPRADRPPTLGHVSVLTREKGVFYLIDLFDALRRAVPSIRIVIAGPSSDPALLDAICEAEQRHAGVFEYRGEIAGDEKDRFYQDIDLFMLPTTLVDEAEPLVMIEAYAHGVDVFATPVGCIPDRIRDHGSILSLDATRDVERVAAAAAGINDNWATQRAACQAHVALLCANGKEQGVDVLKKICGSVGQVLIEQLSRPVTKATKADAS